MNEREQREEELFDAARRLSDAGQRASFLDGACAGDGGLRARVEGLLEAQAEADDLFRPLARPIDPTGALPPAELVDTVIGRYRLREKIGEGGMGIVYLAEQQAPIRRRVALKIIKPGMDTRQVVARFEAERQALALMDHPNIAKVFDGGATESQSMSLNSPIPPGRPYFVMELVEGVPITRFCAENALPVEDRLRLLIAVCQAVQHAHQKGIIHRDLKPSNVLVALHDGVPVPKVIDFGVAKATSQQLTEETFFTQHATMIGTPAYMSPEQAAMRGLDIDTRSDIYSLGVLLYELLTGTQPFLEQRLRSVAYGEMQRIITQEAPERPSTRLRKGRLAAAQSDAAKSRERIPEFSIDSDLDWIVLKCLEKDRNRRYATANGLAMDLKRFVANEPVVARPPSPWYEFRKTVRRHRLGVAATAAVIVALAAAGTISGWALLRERDQRRTADARLQAALAFAQKVLKDVAPQIETLTGAAKPRQDLAQASLELVEQLSEEVAGDPSVQAALARTLLYLSQAQNPGAPNTVGDYEAGRQRAEQAVHLLSAFTPALTEAERLNWLLDARFAQVQCLYGLGRWEEAAARSADLEPLFDELEKPPHDVRRVRRQRWNVRGNAAYACLLAGKPRLASERIQAILESDWSRALNDQSPDDELECLANDQANLATAQGLLHQFDAMAVSAAVADRLWSVLVERDPDKAKYRAGRVEAWAVHGWALIGVGQTHDGIALLERSRQEADALVARDEVNDPFQVARVVAAASEALALAAWSADASAAPPQPRERLDQAERRLAEAQHFSLLAKSKEAEARLALARAEVEAARHNLRQLEGQDPRP